MPNSREKAVLRVLHVIESADPRRGGPIEGVRQLSDVGRRWGQVTDAVTFDRPDAPFLKDNPFTAIALGPVHHKYGYTPRLVPWLRSNAKNYDIVIVNGLWQYNGLAVWRAVPDTGVPYIAFPHGMLDPWFRRAHPLKRLKKLVYWALVERAMLRDARAVCFTCQEELELAQHTFPAYRARNVVTGYGTAGPRGDPDACVAAFFAEFPRLADRRIVLYLGRVHEKKGCDLAIQAFAAIAGRDPSLEFVIAGPADAALKRRLVQLAEREGIADRITWAGMLTGGRKWGALYAAQVFVLPSHQENFGIAVAEALGCGTPVAISNKVNIWREIAASGAGWVEDDTEDGARATLESWLALDAAGQQAARVRARRCFEQHFDIAAVGERFHELMLEVVR
jgi:glycosyltransferase involved in cell wall biosynthesis